MRPGNPRRKAPGSHGRRCLAALTVAVVGVTIAVAASPAGAATATGCSGIANSSTSSGGPLDAVSAPGGGGTKGNPFTVEPDGPVTWDGSTDSVIKNGTWKVTSGIISPSGSFDNDDDKTESEGTKKITDYVPAFVVLPGTYEVTVSVTGEGGSCSANGFVEIESGVATAFWTAMAGIFLALAVFLLLSGRPEAAEAFRVLADRPTDPEAGERALDALDNDS